MAEHTGGPVTTSTRAPLLSGARVFVRHPVESDRAELLAVRVASAAWLRPWDPLPAPGAAGSPQSFVERAIATADTDSVQRHLVCRADTGAIVGMCNLSQIFRGPFDNACMGWWRGASGGGRGYMSEGVSLVLRRAFEQLGLHRMEANIMPRNAASKALAARCGFRFEGYSPSYLQIAGVWEGHDRYAMTREDWGIAKA